MFQEFIDNGNILAVVLLVYAGNVMMEALRRDRLDPHGISTPRIIKHPMSALLMFASIPCAFLPAIYIGSFSGWVAGIISWVGLQFLGGIVAIFIGVRGPLLGFHFILACVAFSIGYYLIIPELLA